MRKGMAVIVSGKYPRVQYTTPSSITAFQEGMVLEGIPAKIVVGDEKFDVILVTAHDEIIWDQGFLLASVLCPDKVPEFRAQKDPYQKNSVF